VQCLPKRWRTVNIRRGLSLKAEVIHWTPATKPEDKSHVTCWIRNRDSSFCSACSRAGVKPHGCWDRHLYPIFLSWSHRQRCLRANSVGLAKRSTFRFESTSGNHSMLYCDVSGPRHAYPQRLRYVYLPYFYALNLSGLSWEGKEAWDHKLGLYEGEGKMWNCPWCLIRHRLHYNMYKIITRFSTQGILKCTHVLLQKCVTWALKRRGNSRTVIVHFPNMTQLLNKRVVTYSLRKTA
jgi:hypothetical protein